MVGKGTDILRTTESCLVLMLKVLDVTEDAIRQCKGNTHWLSTTQCIFLCIPNCNADLTSPRCISLILISLVQLRVHGPANAYGHNKSHYHCNVVKQL